MKLIKAELRRNPVDRGLGPWHLAPDGPGLGAVVCYRPATLLARERELVFVTLPAHRSGQELELLQ